MKRITSFLTFLLVFILSTQVIYATPVSTDNEPTTDAEEYAYHYILDSDGNIITEEEWADITENSIILGEGEAYLIPDSVTPPSKQSRALAAVRVRSTASYHNNKLEVYVELYANSSSSPQFASMSGTVTVVQMSPWKPGGDLYYRFNQYTTGTRTISSYVSTGWGFAPGTKLSIDVRGTATGYNITGGGFSLSYSATVPK